MVQKVKCQHCWKVFEVPEQNLNKQQKCVFCQRMTLAQPLESKDKPTTAIVEQTFEKATGNIVVFLFLTLVILTIANIALACFMGFSRRSGEREVSSESQSVEEKSTADIEKRLVEIETKLDSCYNTLAELEKKNENPKDIIGSLMNVVNDSVTVLFTDIARLKKQTLQLNKKTSSDNK